MNRHNLRFAAMEHPVGSPDLGYFDPVSAIAISTGINAASSIAGSNENADAIDSANRIEKRRLAQLRPFVTAGTEALPQYQANIDKAPTYADVVGNLPNDPGYQFELGQGTDAIQGSAAASGLLRSGRTLKDLAKYAQGLAATRAGDAYSRELGAFQNKQNQLLQLTQMGLSASGAQSQLPSLALNAGQNRADMYTNLANTGTNALSNLALLRMFGAGGGGSVWAGGGPGMAGSIA